MAKTTLQLALEECDYECFEYIGRGMGSKSCLAVRLPDIGKLACMGFDIGENIEAKGGCAHTVREYLSSLRWDNIGYDYVAYFPGVTFEYPEEEEEEEDDNV